MPIVHIDILKRPTEAKRKMARAVTDAIVQSLGVSPESIHIVINQMDGDQYASAGTLFADAKGKTKKITKGNKKK